jgi:hypothetical protein
MTLQAPSNVWLKAAVAAEFAEDTGSRFATSIAHTPPAVAFFTPVESDRRTWVIA